MPVTHPVEIDERRHHRRVSHSGMVRTYTSEGQELMLEVMDYSLGGLGLVSRALFYPGEKLDLDTLITPDGGKRPLGIKGEVCHVQEQFQEYSFGVRFL
jgi:PilZ domain